MTRQLPIIWTAGAIATFLRVGTDGVYALASEPGSPIRRRRGRLYAFEDELEAWMRGAETEGDLNKPNRT
jgi:hypothetical protein